MALTALHGPARATVTVTLAVRAAAAQSYRDWCPPVGPCQPDCFRRTKLISPAIVNGSARDHPLHGFKLFTTESRY